MPITISNRPTSDAADYSVTTEPVALGPEFRQGTCTDSVQFSGDPIGLTPVYSGDVLYATTPGQTPHAQVTIRSGYSFDYDVWLPYFDALVSLTFVCQLTTEEQIGASRVSINVDLLLADAQFLKRTTVLQSFGKSLYAAATVLGILRPFPKNAPPPAARCGVQLTLLRDQQSRQVQLIGYSHILGTAMSILMKDGASGQKSFSSGLGEDADNLSRASSSFSCLCEDVGACSCAHSQA